MDTNIIIVAIFLKPSAVNSSKKLKQNRVLKYEKEQ